MKIFLNKDVVFKDRLVNLLCEGQLLQVPYAHFTAFIEKASEMVEDINKYKLQALTRNFCITFETCYYTITIEKSTIINAYKIIARSPEQKRSKIEFDFTADQLASIHQNIRNKGVDGFCFDESGTLNIVKKV